MIPHLPHQFHFYPLTLFINIYNISRMATDKTTPKHLPTTSMWQYGTGNTPNKIKIATWNVNGIRSIINKGQLQSYINSSQPDIICINETKIDLQAYIQSRSILVKQFNTQINNTHLQNPQQFANYYQYWNFCKVSAGYSGTLTLSKYPPISAKQDFPSNHHLTLQGRTITLQFQNFYLINCYIPSVGSTLSRLTQKTQIYNKQFQNYLSTLQNIKDIIVCGDFNVAHREIDISRPRDNAHSPGFTTEQRYSFDCLLRENKLVDSYRYFHPSTVQYTWWSPRMNSRQKNIGWRIDYILASNYQVLRKTKIKGNIMGSDHCPVECQLQI